MMLFEKPLSAKRPLGEVNTDEWRHLSRIYDSVNHEQRQEWTITFNANRMLEIQVMAGALHAVFNEQLHVAALEPFIDRRWLPT